MQGKAVGDTLIVMDSFALPVQGTETRVNAAEAANEYMVEYVGGSEKVSGLLKHISPISGLTLWPGWAKGECYWVVPFASRLRMLVIRHRREYADHEPKVSGSFRSRRRKSLHTFFSFLSTWPVTVTDRSKSHNLGGKG